MKAFFMCMVCTCVFVGCKNTNEAYRGDDHHIPVVVAAMEYYSLKDVRLGTQQADSLIVLRFNDPRTFETSDAQVTFNGFTLRLVDAVALEPEIGERLDDALRPYVLYRIMANVELSDSDCTRYFIIYLDDPITKPFPDVAFFYDNENGELLAACYNWKDKIYGYLPGTHLIHVSEK